MRELIDLVRAWREQPAGAPLGLATVVATRGSTYRRPGARMLLTDGGWAAGSISGGCLEGDVVRTAWERTENGPVLVTYDATASEDIVWGFGLGCNGAVQVLMQRLPADGGPLAALARCFESREAGVIVTVISEGDCLGSWRWIPEGSQESREHLARGRSQTREFHGQTVLFEPIEPPRPLIVFGAGHDAAPLVAAAKALGWHVTVVDGRSAYARRDRFPEADRVHCVSASRALSEVSVDRRTAAVVMTHNYLHDAEVLKGLLQSRAPYIGLMGPRRRADRLLEDLQREGHAFSPEQLARLHAPIGLDLGAEEPAEIALSIVAEVQAFFSNGSGGFLRGRTAPLHPESEAAIQPSKAENPTCQASA